MVTPLVVLILFLGVYPKPVLDVINPTVDTTMNDIGFTDPCTCPRRWQVIARVSGLAARCLVGARAADPIPAPAIDLIAVMPVMIVLGAACLAVLVEAIVPRRGRYPVQAGGDLRGDHRGRRLDGRRRRPRTVRGDVQRGDRG